jgi:hypothetical protein
MQEEIKSLLFLFSCIPYLAIPSLTKGKIISGPRLLRIIVSQ